MENQLDMFGSKTLFDTNQELKTCTKCNQRLPLNCFSIIGASKRIDGTSRLRNKCSTCYKAAVKQKDALLKITPKPGSNYECPICLNKKGNFYLATEDSSRLKDNSSWCLDHDHKTGKFRGWLCNKCNSALGLLGDNINYIQRALKYLEDCE
tara:strand:- start:766 stop:1221 length:456 start_codon:yes stop_codon:yes gene_type:complete